MWSVGLLCSLLCITVGTADEVHDVVKRQATFSCKSGQTQVLSRRLYAEGTDCGTLIGQITDFYSDAYREECRHWQSLDEKPHRIADAYVKDCMKYSNGTVKYRSQICCEGEVTNQRCFTCLNGTVEYDSLIGGYHGEKCNHYGEVKSCPSGQVCRTTYNFFNRYGSQSSSCSTGKLFDKMCTPDDECKKMVANNSKTCQHYKGDGSCTYCCTGAFCNYQTSNLYLNVCPRKSGCDARPCSYGGTCVANETLSTGYYCICPPWAYGNRCQYTYCNKYPCKNGGYCRYQRSAPYYHCYCRTGWNGTNCTDAYDKCSSDYCLNGGTCFDHKDYGLRCLCPKGYNGAKCEIKNLQCRVPALAYQYTGEHKSNQGKNCTDLNDYYIARKNGYISYCTHKFRWNKFGLIKELQDINVYTCQRGDEYNFWRIEFCCPACYSNPCQNGGWCIEKGNQDYVCKCRYGYQGKSCEYKVASCFATGDPHYKTFDDQMIHFQGKCKYTLASKCEGDKFPDLDGFQVYVKNEPRNGIDAFTYVKNIEVHVFDHVIRMDKDNKIYVDDSIVTPDVSYPGFSISNNGKYVRLETNFSLSVENDGKWTSFVKIGAQYSGATCGICGNYDGNALNDYTQKDGTDVSSKTLRDNLVADSWFVSDSTMPGCSRDVDPPPVCSSAMKKVIALKDYCGYIKMSTSPFYDCISKGIVSRDDYYMSCEYDVCAVMSDPKKAKAAACQSLSVLADNCEQSGFLADWRSLAKCPYDCGEGMSYVRQGSACPLTCKNPDADEMCPYQDTETCVCPEGELLKDGKCVDSIDCGCYHNGKNYEIDDTWTSTDCETFKCTLCEDCVYEVGKVVKVSDGCSEGQQCVYSRCQEPCPYRFQPKDCDQCKAISNTAGYLANPCTCSTYVQCDRTTGVWKGFVRDCPECTCWNQETLTCERKDEACTGSGNSWEGSDGPQVSDDTCSQGAITYQKHAEVTKYNWMTNTGDVVMACPCGTVFDLNKCGCVQKAGYDCKIPKEVTCLSFDAGWNGFQATNWVWVSAGKVKIDPNGVKGKCARFDGKSKLEIPYFTNAYSAYSKFSISFWYKREQGSNGKQGLISNTDCSSKKSIEISSESPGILGGGIRTPAGDATGAFSGIKSSDGQWHHVVLTYDGAKLAFYLDSVKQPPERLSLGGNLVNSHCPLVIGSMFGGNFFKGYIDEVCIYKAGLSAEEVSLMYNTIANK